MSRKLKVIKYSEFIEYETALNRQLEYCEKISKDLSHPYVLEFLEHKPVMTVGKTFESQHLITPVETLKVKGIGYVEVSRGGSITYHGPGQLVMYVHVHLKEIGIFLDTYLRDIEQWVIDVLRLLGIDSFRVEGKTGVWTEKGKICAMGIAAKRFVTYHGIGLNFKVNMEHFKLIVPCGLTEPVASLDQLNQELTLTNLIPCFLECMPQWLKDLKVEQDSI